MTSRRVIAGYFTIAGLYTLAAALIWGVNTLFLLDAGLLGREAVWVLLLWAAGIQTAAAAGVGLVGDFWLAVVLFACTRNAGRDETAGGLPLGAGDRVPHGVSGWKDDMRRTIGSYKRHSTGRSQGHAAFKRQFSGFQKGGRCPIAGDRILAC